MRASLLNERVDAGEGARMGESGAMWRVFWVPQGVTSPTCSAWSTARAAPASTWPASPSSPTPSAALYPWSALAAPPTGSATTSPCTATSPAGSAQCRAFYTRPAHPGPVVMFAADRVRAVAPQPLVESSRCGFNLDPIRPELLVINGRSAQDTLRLGRGRQGLRDYSASCSPGRRGITGAGTCGSPGRASTHG